MQTIGCYKIKQDALSKVKKDWNIQQILNPKQFERNFANVENVERSPKNIHITREIHWKENRRKKRARKHTPENLKYICFASKCSFYLTWILLCVHCETMAKYSNQEMLTKCAALQAHKALYVIEARSYKENACICISNICLCMVIYRATGTSEMRFGREWKKREMQWEKNRKLQKM